MRVLYFHQHFSTREGTGGTRSYEFSQELLTRGHTVVMVCGSGANARTGLSGPFANGIREGVVDGIEVLELDLPYSNNDGLLKRSATFAQFAARASLIAMRQPCDIVFATSTPLTAGIPGVLGRIRHPRRPFVFEVRDLWPELPKAMGVVTNPFVLAAMGALEWISYRAASGLIGLSPGICDGIRSRAGNRPVTMIPNGSDLDLFKPNPQAERSGDAGRFRFVFCGAHGQANGLDNVLDAAAELVAGPHSDIEVHLIGSGGQKETLQRRAASEGLSNVFFHDAIPKSVLATQLPDFDAGLMVLANVPAFYFGTSPNKFFDYVSAGLPVLTNYPGWVAGLIESHDCGTAVEPGRPALLADAMVEMSKNRAATMQMGRNARAMAESDFSRSRGATMFVEFLESVATR